MKYNSIKKALYALPLIVASTLYISNPAEGNIPIEDRFHSSYLEKKIETNVQPQPVPQIIIMPGVQISKEEFFRRFIEKKPIPPKPKQKF